MRDELAVLKSESDQLMAELRDLLKGRITGKTLDAVLWDIKRQPEPRNAVEVLRQKLSLIGLLYFIQIVEESDGPVI